MEYSDTRTVFTKLKCNFCGLPVESGSACLCANSGGAFFPLAEEPEFAGKFQFYGCLGSGGMGSVFKAKQLALDKVVAIKVINQTAMTDAAIRRFTLEGKTAAKLNHPNLIQVWDLGVTSSGHPYLVLEYVEGVTLSQLLKVSPQMDLPRFHNIFSQLCRALQHAHENGVVHRDIKPGNIIISRTPLNEEFVKVMDFGIAKFVGDENLSNLQLTRTGEAIGSPLYMSPEQARGQRDIDGRSDLYSLGCIMYEALTGLPPFVGSTFIETILKHQNEKAMPLKEASMGLNFDPNLERIVMKLLAKNPNDRYQSAKALLEDIDAQALSSQSATGSSSETFQIKQTRPIAYLAGAIAISAIVAIFAFENLHPRFGVWQKNTDQKLATAPNELARTPDSSSTRTMSGDQKDANENSSDNFYEDVKKSIHDDPEGTLYLSGRCLAYNVSLSTQVLAKLLDVKGFRSLQKLSLAKCLPTDDLNLSNLSKLKRLRELNLASVHLQNLQFLTEIKSIESLNLRGATITTGGIKPICSLPSLSFLDLSETNVTPLEISTLVKSLPALKEVLVYRCLNLNEQSIAKIQSTTSCAIRYTPHFDRNDIDALIKERRFTEARSVANITFKRLSSESEKNYTEFADLDFRRGEIELAESHINAAISYYDSSLANLQKAPFDVLRREKFMLRLAEACESEQNWQRAIQLRKELSILYQKYDKEEASNQRRHLIINNLRNHAIDSAHLRDKEQEKILSLQCVDACKTFGLENTPECVNSLIALGDYYRLQKGLSKAINYYKESIDLYRDHAELHINPEVRQNLGLCYFASEKWAKAEESFKGYLQENPSGGKAVVNYLIVALMKQHKESEATRLKSQYSI